MLKTNQLLIVAGPSAVGKSTLLERIQQGDVPHLYHQLNLDLSSARYLAAIELPRVHQSFMDQIVLHYDFLSHYSLKGGFVHLPNLVENSRSVVCLTLCTSSKTLLKRINSRLTQGLISYWYGPEPRKVRTMRKIWRKRKSYKRSANVYELYENWSRFIGGYDVAKHLLLDSSRFNPMIAKPYEGCEIRKLVES